uniref:HAP2-GCS1 domain-containing protein n=1 Tax=Rhabditophanes sp. KR3021 TaxID=114890 RepID=A0AC35U4J6_9BILA
MKTWLVTVQCLLIPLMICCNSITNKSNDLPHCTRTTTMQGILLDINDIKNGTNEKFSLQNQMTLMDTSCIMIHKKNETDVDVLHTLQYLRLEQHYPITGEYSFGIPQIETSCVCDCAGGDQHCNSEMYKYQNCSAASVCYRTYHPFQSSAGCLTSKQSELCCEMKIEPYKNWIFQAVRLRQPDTFLIFRYKVYERIKNEWYQYNDDIIDVPLNKGGAKFHINSYHKIELIVGGSRPQRQVEPGMYFYKKGYNFDRYRDNVDVKTGVSINDVTETNLDKLGWLRFERGRWQVKKGTIKLTQAHHANVINCKQQIYTSTFDAEQFIMNGIEGHVENYDLGVYLKEDPWIDKISVEERVIKISHAEGISVFVNLKTDARPKSFYHSSHFSSFNGTIELDKDSNRFLNITIFGGKGTLIGQVISSSENKDVELVFSIQIDNSLYKSGFKAIIPLPASINATRNVCFYPSDHIESQSCKWIRYSSVPMMEYSVAEKWLTEKANCYGCNERGIDNIVLKLDPRTWFDGINSPTELIMCIFEISLGIVALILTICIFTKCIIPLLTCTLSIGSCFSCAKVHNKS